MRPPVILLLCGLLLAACGGGSGGTKIRFAVVDQELREPGGACSGAGGYLYIHKDAPFEIVDGSGGAVLAKGVLPSGEAVRLGDPIQGAAVEPTACEFTFSVDLPDRPRYALRLSQGSRVPFSAGDGTVRIRIP